MIRRHVEPSAVPTDSFGSGLYDYSVPAGARVLLVDDDPKLHDLMDRIFEKTAVRGLHAYDGREALALASSETLDMVISDIVMPTMDGWELCRSLKSDPDTMLLPILILTSRSALSDKIRAFDTGADEYVTKPFQPEEMAARIRSMLRLKRLRGTLENAEKVIFAFARAVEAKDAYTAGHTERVSSLAVVTGMLLGLGTDVAAQLYRGGILHDIGKIGVPDSILNKPVKLTPAEFARVKRHPAVGENICRGMNTLKPVLKIIRHHHEKLDGSGYPDGIEGDAICMTARIMAACDVYDALTSTRSYRDAMSRPEAMKILDEGVAAGHWDGNVVACLRDVVKRKQGPPNHANQES